MQSPEQQVESKPQGTRWDLGTSNAWQGPNQTLAKPQLWQRLSQKKKKVPRCFLLEPEALLEGPTERKGILKRHAWHRWALAGRTRGIKASGENTVEVTRGHVLQAQAIAPPPSGHSAPNVRGGAAKSQSRGHRRHDHRGLWGVLWGAAQAGQGWRSVPDTRHRPSSCKAGGGAPPRPPERGTAARNPAQTRGRW